MSVHPLTHALRRERGRHLHKTQSRAQAAGRQAAALRRPPAACARAGSPARHTLLNAAFGAAMQHSGNFYTRTRAHRHTSRHALATKQACTKQRPPARQRKCAHWAHWLPGLEGSRAGASAGGPPGGARNPPAACIQTAILPSKGQQYLVSCVSRSGIVCLLWSLLSGMLTQGPTCSKHGQAGA